MSRGLSQNAWWAAYAPFKPSDSEQRLPPLSYRGCWHRVSRGFLWYASDQGAINTRHLVTPDSGLHPEGLRPARGVAPSRFRALRNIRCCSPPWRSGQCLSPDVAGRPLRPATRLSLGRPLPYQQADMTRAAPKPTASKDRLSLAGSGCPEPALSGITQPFDWLSLS